jgi:hypothetical protein
MSRTLLALTLALGAATAVRAQGYVPPRVSPFGNGGISPYLNLLRGGNPAVNYYGLVRPEIQARTSIQQLQTEVARQQASTVAPPTNQALIDTGHPPRFMQYNQYFNTTAAPRPQAGSGPAQPATFGRR